MTGHSTRTADCRLPPATEPVRIHEPIARDSKPVDVTELDVIKNPGGVKIVPLEAAQAPRAIDDADFAAIQGKFRDLQRA